MKKFLMSLVVVAAMACALLALAHQPVLRVFFVGHGYSRLSKVGWPPVLPENWP